MVDFFVVDCRMVELFVVDCRMVVEKGEGLVVLIVVPVAGFRILSMSSIPATMTPFPLP